MTETKFTLGPWRMIHSIRGDNLHAWIFGKDPSEGTTREIQVLSINEHHPIKEHNQRRLADMRLIAAAPEMYELLEAILEENPSLEQIRQKAFELKNKINNPCA